MPDLSLAEFGAFLTEITVETEHRTHDALDEAAQIVQAEARRELGTYQDATGPFPAWAELADATKDDRVHRGYTENDPGLRSGAMRDSIERTVEGHEAHVGSDDEHLVYFELGTSKQPPRSVLAGSLIRKTDEVVEVVGKRVFGRLVGDGVSPSLPYLRDAE